MKATLKEDRKCMRALATQALTSISIEKECDHIFVIITGSGKLTGVPSWKCTRCNKIIKSS